MTGHTHEEPIMADFIVDRQAGRRNDLEAIHPRDQCIEPDFTGPGSEHPVELQIHTRDVVTVDVDKDVGEVLDLTVVVAREMVAPDIRRRKIRVRACVKTQRNVARGKDVFDRMRDIAVVSTR